MQLRVNKHKWYVKKKERKKYYKIHAEGELQYCNYGGGGGNGMRAEMFLPLPTILLAQIYRYTLKHNPINVANDYLLGLHL